MDIVTFSLCKKLISNISSGIESYRVEGQTLHIIPKNGNSLRIDFPTPKDGIGVKEIHIDDNYTLSFTMTDESTIIAGKLPKPEIQISSKHGNILKNLDSGLYVPASSVNISTIENNLLKADEEGLYVLFDTSNFLTSDDVKNKFELIETISSQIDSFITEKELNEVNKKIENIEEKTVVMTGSNSIDDGKEGFVPKPLSADKDKFLSGDGTWKTVITGISDGSITASKLAEEIKTSLKKADNAVQIEEGKGLSTIDVTQEVLDKTNIAITEKQSDNYAKTYFISQGKKEIGFINIPKDLVISNGSVVNLEEGEVEELPAGKYIKIIISNKESTPLYIAVNELVDAYTASSEPSNVIIEINDNNIISAKISNNFITTEISNKSTNEQVPSAKAAYDNLAVALKENITIYVNHNNGNDKTGDGSIGKPYATIQKAVDMCPDKSKNDNIYTITIENNSIYDEEVNINNKARIIITSNTGNLNPLRITKMLISETFVTLSCYLEIGNENTLGALSVSANGRVMINSDLKLVCSSTKTDYKNSCLCCLWSASVSISSGSAIVTLNGATGITSDNTSLVYLGAVKGNVKTAFNANRGIIGVKTIDELVYTTLSTGTTGGGRIFLGEDDDAKLLLTSKTIYVNAETGDDATGLGTSEKPYATIQKALTDLPQVAVHNASVTINIKDGIYEESPSISNKPYTIVMTCDGNVTISGRLTILNCNRFRFNYKNSTSLTIGNESQTIALYAQSSNVLFDKNMVNFIMGDTPTSSGACIYAENSNVVINSGGTFNFKGYAGIFSTNNSIISADILTGSVISDALRARRGFIMYNTSTLVSTNGRYTSGEQGGKIYCGIQTDFPLETDKTVYVATNGSDTSGLGTSEKPYKTIQKAIDMCPSSTKGDYKYTIEIASGTYAEDLKIVGKIPTIVLMSAGNVVISGSTRIVGSIRVEINVKSSANLFTFGNSTVTQSIYVKSATLNFMANTKVISTNSSATSTACIYAINATVTTDNVASLDLTGYNGAQIINSSVGGFSTVTGTIVGTLFRARRGIIMYNTTTATYKTLKITEYGGIVTSGSDPFEIKLVSVNYHGATAKIKYNKYQLTVEIMGVLTSNTQTNGAYEVLTILPEGYRPTTSTIRYALFSSLYLGQIIVSSNGEVKIGYSKKIGQTENVAMAAGNSIYSSTSISLY